MVTNWDVIERAPGNFSFKVKNLRTSELVTRNDHDRVEAASTIKLLILCCLLYEAQKGALSLAELVHITPEDITPDGSGILQHARPHGPLELEHLALLMMAVSDNIATNAIIGRISKMKVNEYAAALDLRHTRLLVDRLDFTTKTEGFKLGVTTADEMFQLLERLAGGSLLDPQHTTIALNMLNAVQGSTFARGINIASFKSFGSKTGWLYSPSRGIMTINECGMFTNKAGAVTIFSMFSTVPMDKRRPYSLDSTSRRSFVRVAKAVHREVSK